MLGCDRCGREFRDGDRVVGETPGQIVNGKFQQTEEATLCHDECPEF